MSTRPQPAVGRHRALQAVPELSEDDTPTLSLTMLQITRPPRPILRVIKGGRKAGAAVGLVIVIVLLMNSAFRFGLPASLGLDPDAPAAALGTASPSGVGQRRQLPTIRVSQAPRELPIEPPKPEHSSPPVIPVASITAPWMAAPAPLPYTERHLSVVRHDDDDQGTDYGDDTMGNAPAA